MNRSIALLAFFFLLPFRAFVAPASAGENPFIGYWALTIPGGGAGWLGVEQTGGQLRAEMLWGVGSVQAVHTASMAGDHLVLTRLHENERTNALGKTEKFTTTETITATVNGDELKLTTRTSSEDGNVSAKKFSGKRIPPMPPAPDLSAVSFGPPVTLFNGRDLTGWRLVEPDAINGWSARDGVLVNRVEKEPGASDKSYGNLRTEREFEDFNLTLETRLGKEGNSGVYLRGMYEVQVYDSFGQALDSHHMGAIYSRVKPVVNAEKPAGEWQSLDITFVDRHVTVLLNGTKIIDNQPVPGCTGGALWSDVLRPGPIYLQGDHTGIEYRNLVLRPVAK